PRGQGDPAERTRCHPARGQSGSMRAAARAFGHVIGPEDWVAVLLARFGALGVTVPPLRLKSRPFDRRSTAEQIGRPDVTVRVAAVHATVARRRAPQHSDARRLNVKIHPSQAPHCQTGQPSYGCLSISHAPPASKHSIPWMSYTS